MAVWYKGERYKSVQALISELNIENLTPAAVYGRLRRGWNVEDALDHPMHPLIASVRRNAPHGYVDHTGRQFETLTAMARAWGLARECLYNRLQRGWPVEEALTLPPVKTGRARPVWIFEGRKFSCIKSLVDTLKAEGREVRPYKGVLQQLAEGQTLDYALSCGFVWRDHLGATYRTCTAMARAWGLTRDTLQGRLDRGWDIKKALTEPVNHYRGGQTVDPPERTDHTGKEWPSQAAMAIAWGISPASFHTRRYKKGMSIEEALTAEKRPRTGRPGKLGHEFIYAGTHYRSVAELCRALKIPESRTYARLVRGASVDDAVRDVLPDDRRRIRKP